MTRLTWAQVTGWRLSRGHLTRRRSATRLLQVVADLCGAHAQIMSSVPLALSARVSRLEQDRIDTALREDRTLVKTWAMRGTLHVLASEDLALYCAAQRTRDQYTNPSFLRYAGLQMGDVEAVLDAVPRALDGRALTRGDLIDRILRISKRPHLEDRLRSGWGELLKPAAFRGLLCFGPQTGRTVTFVRPDQWLGRWEDLDTDQALQEVFRRFLHTYGPATREEVARWWGVRPPEAGRVLGLMREDLVQVDAGDAPRWMLGSDLQAARRAPPGRGVRLLPAFDQLLVMSAPHPQAIVDEKYADRLYRPRTAVWSLPAVLMDGRVRGSWALEKKRERILIRVRPFDGLPRSSERALAKEAGAVGTLLGTEADLEVVRD